MRQILEDRISLLDKTLREIQGQIRHDSAISCGEVVMLLQNVENLNATLTTLRSNLAALNLIDG